MAQREQRALQTDSSAGRAMAAAGRTLRSGLKAMTEVLTPRRRQAATEQQGTDGPERQTEMSTPARDLFETDTPEKPRRPVPARSSDVVAMCASEAAVAQGQRDLTAAAPEEYARALVVSVQMHSSQDGAVVQGDSFAQMLQILQRMQEGQTQMQEGQTQMRAEMQEMRAEVQRVQTEVRAEMQEMRAEVQQVQTKVRAEMQQRMLEVGANQAQLRAQIVGVESTLEQLAKDKESAGAQVQQLRQEQGKRIDAIEQRLLQHRDEEEKLRGNEIRVVRQEAQQVIEEHLRVHEQQFIGREEQLKIVEQQNHGKELEEQAMQELRDEVQMLRKEHERLREEQEKMKGNEKRICAKIEQYMRASAELVKVEAIDPLLAKYEQLEMASPSTETSLVQKGAEATSSAALPSPVVDSKTSKPLVFGFSAGPWPKATEVVDEQHTFDMVLRKHFPGYWSRTRPEFADRLPQEMQCFVCKQMGHFGRDCPKVRVSEMPRQKDERDSDDDSDDDDQQRAPEPDWNMECCRVEISEPESLQFRDAFEEGRAQAHSDIAFQEGYQHGEKEAAANWEIEREMAGSHSSACVTDSMLDEREAERSAEDETRSSGGNEREAEGRTEEETRSGGSNERGAENGEEEDWRTAQWEPLDFVW